MNHSARFLKALCWSALFGFSSCSAQDESASNPTKPEPTPAANAPAERGRLFRRIGKVESTLIKESSGLAASSHRSDAFWTIDDSGHPPRVFCLSQTGKLLAMVEFQTGSNRDWESMSRFSIQGRHYLVVADVGDNFSRYTECRLYIFEEPQFALGDEPKLIRLSPITIEFNYQDGARDCEAVAVDPQTHDLWLFEKMMQLNLRRKPSVYRIPADQWLPLLDQPALPAQDGERGRAAEAANGKAAKRLTAIRIGSLNHPFVTGGEFSPDGNQLLLRTYTYAVHFQKPAAESWSTKFADLKPTLIAIPLQSQGEAIEFFPNPETALVSSEGVKQPLWLIDLKASLTRAPK